VQLVIIGFRDVVEHPYDVEMLKRVSTEKGFFLVSSEEFLAQANHWLTEARQVKGELIRLPKKRTIALVGYENPQIMGKVQQKS